MPGGTPIHWARAPPEVAALLHFRLLSAPSPSASRSPGPLGPHVLTHASPWHCHGVEPSIRKPHSSLCPVSTPSSLGLHLNGQALGSEPSLNSGVISYLTCPSPALRAAATSEALDSRQCPLLGPDSSCHHPLLSAAFERFPGQTSTSFLKSSSGLEQSPSNVPTLDTDNLLLEIYTRKGPALQPVVPTDAH